jgi:hypothetical protein
VILLTQLQLFIRLIKSYAFSGLFVLTSSICPRFWGWLIEMQRKMGMRVGILILIALLASPCGTIWAQINQTQGGLGTNRTSSRTSRSTRDSQNQSGNPTANGLSGSSRSRDRESDRGRNAKKANTTPGATPAPGQPAQPGDKALSKIKGKATPKKASGGGEARGTSSVEFKMRPDMEANVVYVEAVGSEPTMNILATEGKKFVTRVGLQNNRGTGFQSLAVTLRFDPGVMRAVGIDDSDLQSLLQEDAEATVDPSRGLVHYAATLTTESLSPSQTFFKVEWMALSPGIDTPLAFVNKNDMKTAILDADGKNILLPLPDAAADEPTAKTGMLDASVTISPSEATAGKLRDQSGSFSAIALVNNISMGTAEGGLELELRPRSTSVKLGEEFLVDVNYRNPLKAELDTVKLKIKFDPKSLQVVDYDTENWITQGINIFDAEYHEDLPFTYHRKNSAYNTSGFIVYDMGFANRVHVPSNGTIATIKFRAAGAPGATGLSFLVDETNDTVDPLTSVSFLGFNLIGKPGERQASLKGATVELGSF